MRPQLKHVLESKPQSYLQRAEAIQYATEYMSCEKRFQVCEYLEFTIIQTLLHLLLEKHNHLFRGMFQRYCRFGASEKLTQRICHHTYKVPAIIHRYDIFQLMV